jgi:putative transposase
LLVAIRTSFEQSDRTYGSPRVRRDLFAWGHSCSENRVARLMLAVGLQARRKRRRLPMDGGVLPEGAIAPNLLDRCLDASGSNGRRRGLTAAKAYQTPVASTWACQQHQRTFNQ